MSDHPDATAHGAIVADLGANLVAILVILLAVVSLSAPGGSRTITPTIGPPLSGQEQSDLLYLRLRPPSDVLIVELAEDGAFVLRDGALLPLTDGATSWPTRSAAFVFSPRHHAAFRDMARRHGVSVAEITVPTALRRPDPEAGQSGFSPAFLAIRPGRDAASIRPELLKLLTSGPGGRAFAGTAVPRVPTTGLAERLIPALHLGLNVALLVASLAFLRHLRKRFP